MFESLPTSALLAILIASTGAIYATGRPLADSTDVLSTRWGLGEALGGMILLAIVTNLPEVAIITSAAVGDNVDMAIGNILGGIACQTLVLAVIDRFGGRHSLPLTSRVQSLAVAFEGLLVMVVLTFTIIGVMLPHTPMVGRVSLPEILIAVAWVFGLRVVASAREGLAWALPPGGNVGGASLATGGSRATEMSSSTALWVFLATALVTLLAGVLLERASDELAGRLGMSGLLFGATVLAILTSLPEITTGIASARAGKAELAVSDIFGGNAFLPLLFLLASLITAQPILPDAGAPELYLTALGILLTAVYLFGILSRSRRRPAGMGIDSWLVLLLYAVGVLGLLSFSTGSRARAGRAPSARRCRGRRLIA